MAPIGSDDNRRLYRVASQDQMRLVRPDDGTPVAGRCGDVRAPSDGWRNCGSAPVWNLSTAISRSSVDPDRTGWLNQGREAADLRDSEGRPHHGSRQNAPKRLRPPPPEPAGTGWRGAFGMGCGWVCQWLGTVPVIVSARAHWG